MDICKRPHLDRSMLILSSIFDSQTMLHESLKFHMVCIPWNKKYLFDVFEKIHNAENSDIQAHDTFAEQCVIDPCISAGEYVRGVAVWICHFPQSKILHDFMECKNLFHNHSIKNKALKVVKMITLQRPFIYKLSKKINANDKIACEMAISRFITNS